MLKNTENIALQNLQILYTFVLHAKIAIQQILEGYIFYILQHFPTKLCNFTNFSMSFPGIFFFC
jgi:succinate dehydrogenase hydrophobic anchor subunit